MLKIIKQCCDFDDLYRNSWGQAVEILNEIRGRGYKEELMDCLEDCFPDGADEIELNDLLAYDWKWVYSQIGMSLEAYDDTDDLIDEAKEGD